MAYFDNSDPYQNNYGVPSRGQLNPDSSKDLRSAFNQSPMLAGLNQPPPQPQAQGTVSQPAAKPTPITGATGTFGPKTFTQNLQTRGQTDFSKGLAKNPHTAGGNVINAVSQAANKFPGGPPLGIGRRAAGSQNDLSVGNATQAIQNASQSYLGRQMSPQDIQSALAGQGLKAEDRWVGQTGLQSILQSIQNSDEANSFRNQTPVSDPGTINEMGNSLAESPFQNLAKSPMQSALGSTGGSGAELAYQEYLSEFGPGDPETPISFDQFQVAYNQLGNQVWDGQVIENEDGRFGWNNLNLNEVDQKGGSRFEGFDDSRALSGGDAKSVKDTFRRVVGGLGIDLSGLKSFDEVENMLRTQVAPALQAAGVNVLDVAKDKILVETYERGPEWVDVVGDATGADPRWWWGADGDSSGGGIGVGNYPWDNLSLSLQSGSGNGSEDGQPDQQSALLSSLGFGNDWKSLLEGLIASQGV